MLPTAGKSKENRNSESKHQLHALDITEANRRGGKDFFSSLRNFGVNYRTPGLPHFFHDLFFHIKLVLPTYAIYFVTYCSKVFPHNDDFRSFLTF